MTDLTEQEVCIGSLGQQKVYLHWSDVKDICTYAVSAAYEQTKRENAQLKDVLKTIKRQCELLLPKNGLAPVGDRQILCRTFYDLIDEVLK